MNEGSFFGAKKGGTNVLAVRAGRPVTQTTSSSEGYALPPPSLEYIHHNIGWVECKYKNRNLFGMRSSNPFRLESI
jgi:hypothetical protein